MAQLAYAPNMGPTLTDGDENGYAGLRACRLQDRQVMVRKDPLSRTTVCMLKMA